MERNMQKSYPAPLAPEHRYLLKYSETCLYRPPNGILLCLLELILVAKGHVDELQKAEIVSTSKLVPSVIIKTHYLINHR